MPYYCTVPRCTSMAGKAKNVSFHQFPRDEELAKLWNRILKRGKPYTKYSKVCSLHFRPEDYTITSVGKNKGQWRTLRKDAIPSQNLPSESPVPYTRSPGAWLPSQPAMPDPMVQQQMAQAIYMQTMLAMQAAGASDAAVGDQPTQVPESTNPSPSSSSLSEIELLLRRDEHSKEVTFKCHECSKCFKDPDVYVLHKRTHKNTPQIEKENFSTNIQDREETLRANPILANLLKTSMRLKPETNMSNILSVENQIMAALASNMEAYIRTLSSMITSQANRETEGNDDVEQDRSDYEETKDMSTDREADEVDYDSDKCATSNEHIDEDNKGQNAEGAACVSRIATPIEESQEFNDSADISTEDTLEGTKEDQSENDNRNINVESIQRTIHDTQNHQNDDERMESMRELEKENEVFVNENHDVNGSKTHDRRIKENDIPLENNHVNSPVNNDKIVDTAIVLQDSDENEICREDMVTNVADENNIIDENKESIDDKRKDESQEHEGKLDQAITECDTEAIRIQLEI